MRVTAEDGTAQVFLADAEASLGRFAEAADALQTAIARSGGAEAFAEAWGRFCLERFRILWRSRRDTKRGEAVAFRVEATSYPEGSKSRESLLENSAAADAAQKGIWGELGLAQLELRDVPKAQASLKEAQTREPASVETLELEAMAAAVEGNWTVAEQRLTALGARSPAEMRGAVELWRHVFAANGEVSEAAWPCQTTSCPVEPTRARHERGAPAQELYAEGRWEDLVALPAPGKGRCPGWSSWALKRRETRQRKHNWERRWSRRATPQRP